MLTSGEPNSPGADASVPVALIDVLLAPFGDWVGGCCPRGLVKDWEEIIKMHHLLRVITLEKVVNKVVEELLIEC